MATDGLQNPVYDSQSSPRTGLPKSPNNRASNNHSLDKLCLPISLSPSPADKPSPIDRQLRKRVGL
uniref:Uncharacterized protein n=1 Tax=Arabidopsis thaliana TaxID=3702 RepID=Q0WP27_ARATH|nr:hypothetical protein [Arabidopsis thaliana]